MFQSYSLKAEQLSTIIFLTSLILRNSPQIFYYTNKEEVNHIDFIYKLIDFPRCMRMILILINMILLIVSLILIMLWKIKTYYFQIFYYILAPISVVFIQRLLIKQWQKSDLLGVVLFGISETLVVAFLVTYPILQFRIKTNKTQTINEIGQIYSLATNISFILMSFTPILDLNNNTILALLFGVYLTRSIIVLLKINYESIEIQYLSLLGEIYSWIGLVLLLVKVNYGVQVDVLCWANLLMVVYLAVCPSSSLVSILQGKYVRVLVGFKLRLGNYSQDDNNKDDENQHKNERNTGNNDSFQHNRNNIHTQQQQLSTQIELIELFCCLIVYIKGKQQQKEDKHHNNYEHDSQNKHFILLSQYFYSQVIEVVRLMVKRQQLMKNNKNDDDIGFVSNNKYKSFNTKRFNLKQHQYKYISSRGQRQQQQQKLQQQQNQNQQQHYNQNNNLWNIIIKHINQQLQQSNNYTKLRQFIIYNMSITNNMDYYQLLKFYYLNVCQQRENKGYRKVVNQMTYQYLTKGLLMGLDMRERRWRAMSGNEQEKGMMFWMDQRNRKENRKENRNGQNNVFQYDCLTTSSRTSSLPQHLYQQTLTYFNLYYEQTQTQQQILNKFSSIFSINQQLIQQVSSKRQESNQKVLSILVQKNELKRQVRQLILKLYGNNYINQKGVLFMFVYEYCVQNRPYVAVNNFKLLMGSGGVTQLLLSNSLNINNNGNNNNNNSNNRQVNNTKTNMSKTNINKSNHHLYQQKQLKQKSPTTSKTKNNNYNNNNNNNRMILFISGIQNFGKIVHCCEQFRQKMDLKKMSYFNLSNNSSNSSNSKNNDNFSNITNNVKLSIYDIMLPLWVQKHMQITKGVIMDGRYFTHTSNKVHLVSTHQKRIYECSLIIYPIVRNTHDLLLAIDIRQCRQLSKLTIYHNERQVFHSVVNRYSNRNDSRVTFIKSRKLLARKGEQQNDRDGQQNDNDNDKRSNKCIKSKQMIFGEQYVLIRCYKKQKCDVNSHVSRRREKQNNNNIIMKNTNNNNNTIKQTNSQQNNSQKQQQQIFSINLDNDNDNNNSINQKIKFSQLSFYQQQQKQQQQLPSDTMTNSNTITSLKHLQQQQPHHHYQNTQQFDQLLNKQIKMNQYIKKTLFHKNKLLTFTFMHWSIPPIILTACLFLRFYTAQSQTVSNNITDTKINLYQKFLLIDTHMLTQLYYINMLDQYNSDIQQFRNNILPYMLEDLKYTSDFISTREKDLYKQLSSSQQLLEMFLHDDQSIGSTSVYFTQLIFDLQTQDYLQYIGFNVHNQNDNDNLNTIYANGKKVDIDADRFFHKFKHRYQRYFQEINSLAILPTLSQLQLQTYQYSQNFFLICLIALIGMSVMTGITFVFVYIYLEFNVQKLVLKCLDLPDQLMRKVHSSINQSKRLLQNCNQNQPMKILQKINPNSSYETQTSFNSAKTKKTFRSRAFVKKYHHKVQIYSSFKTIFYNKSPIIMFYFLIIVILLTFLAFLIAELQSDIQNSKNFSSGVQKLTGLVSLSNEITMQIFLKFDNPNNLDTLATKQHEFYHLQKINFISSIQPDHQKFLDLVFFDICNLKNHFNNKTICPNYNLNTTFSYAEVVASSYKVFKQIEEQLRKIQNLPKEEQFKQIDIHFSKLIKYLSLLNRYVHEMINIGRRNLQNSRSNPQIFFYLVVVEMIFVCFSFNWFTYKKMYKNMKIYYQQAFKTCPLHQMQAHKDMEFYFNQSKQQKINYVSGTYNINT